MATKKQLGPYDLGPQKDGSIIVRIPSDSHLVTARKAFEKQAKNATAARGTISALKEGSDPMLDEVDAELADLIKCFAGAREPAKQMAGTPIGEALAAATAAATSGESQEQIDGAEEGTVWAPHTPKPRPRLGHLIVSGKGGAGIGITQIDGYNMETGAFEVRAGNATYGVVSHWEKLSDVDNGSARLVWRIRGENYSTPRVEPNVDSNGPRTVAEDLTESAREGSAAAKADLAADANDTDAAGEPRTSAPPSKAAKKTAAKKAVATPAKSSAQRDRNASANGLKGGKKR